MSAKANPGAVLKSMRLQKGLTLSELAERTGLPVSTLSKLENQKMSLTYDKLARVSKGLDLDISALFSENGNAAAAVSTGRRSVMRSGEGRTIETDHYDHLYVATELLNKRFVPVIAEIKARSIDDFGALIRHPGDEYAYVLEGAVELHSDLYAPLRLDQGDSVYFDSGMGHAYIAVGPGSCRILSICSGVESQLIDAHEIEEATRSPPKARGAAPIKLTRRKRAASI